MMRLDSGSNGLMVLRMVAALVVPGCSSQDADVAGWHGGGGGGGEGEGEGERPARASEPAPAYACVSHFGVGAGLLLPEPADAALGALEGLGEHPGEAMLDLAEAAGVPAVGDVRDALPAVVEGELTGFLDDQLRAQSPEQGSPAERIGELAAALRGSLASFDLVTVLELPEGRDGTGRHRVDSIVLSPLSEEPIVVPAELVAIAGIDDVDVSIEPSASSDGTATVALGDHAFGLPVGSIAQAALDELLERSFGVPDLRTALGTVVDCDAVAEAVAEQCVAFVCVGHEADLRNICEGALDRVASELEDQLSAIDFNAVHLLSGRAALRDAALGEAPDGVLDVLEGGVWDARLNVGMGERHSAATFEGRAIRAQQ